MSTRIGAIHVDLGLSTAQFQKGVQSAKKEAAGLGASLKSSLGGIAKNFGAGLLAGVTAGGIAGIASQFAVVADNIASIGDEAAKAGVSTKVFQEWRYLAEQARIPIDSLVDGFKELSIRADEFATTGKGSAAEAFARLGLKPAEVKERLKDPAEFMLLLIERTRQLGDTAAGIRIFDELFGGTGGERMVSLLQMSDDELRNIASSAQAAGRVLDDDLIKKAAELDKAFKGVSGTVSTYLQGAIIRAADDLWSFIELFQKWENVRRSTVDERLAAIGKERLALEKQILETKHEQSNITGNASDLGFDAPTAGVYSGQAEEVARLQQQMAALAAEEERILAARKGIDDLPPKPSASTAWTPSIVPDGNRDKAAEAAGREAEAVRRLISELEHELRLVGATDLQRETANALRQAGAAATAEQEAKIVSLIAAIHAEEEATRKATEAAQELRDIGRDVLGGMVNDLVQGKSAADALADALRNVGNRLLNMAMDGLFNSIKIPGFAKGTDFAPGGLAVVGERGPELVNLPRGAQVIPNHQIKAPTMPKLTGTGGGGGTVHAPVTIHIDATGADAAGLARVEASVKDLSRKIPQMVDARTDRRNVRRDRA